MSHGLSLGGCSDVSTAANVVVDIQKQQFYSLIQLQLWARGNRAVSVSGWSWCPESGREICNDVVVSAQIAMDEHGSKGYGFVHFETEEAARSSIEKVNGMLLNGKKVWVCRLL